MAQKIELIEDIELRSKGIESLSDRPNQSPIYGGNGMSARELKQAFDALAFLLKNKINELITAYGENASDYVVIKLEDETEISLGELATAFENGSLANGSIGLSLNARLSPTAEDVQTLQSIIYQLNENVSSVNEQAIIAHSRSIKLINVFYAITDSADQQPETWQPTIPIAQFGQYLWTKIRFTFESDDYTDCITVVAIRGDKGADGRALWHYDGDVGQYDSIITGNVDKLDIPDTSMLQTGDFVIYGTYLYEVSSANATIFHAVKLFDMKGEQGIQGEKGEKGDAGLDEDSVAEIITRVISANELVTPDYPEPELSYELNAHILTVSSSLATQFEIYVDGELVTTI